MNFVHLFVALAEFALAAALLHQTLVVLDTHGRQCAWRLWLLGMSIGLFGVGRFTNFLDGTDGPLVYTLAHLCLITYGTKRWLTSRRVHGTAKEMYERSSTREALRSLHLGRDDAFADRRAAGYPKRPDA